MSIEQTISKLTEGHQPVRLAHFSSVLMQTALLVLVNFVLVTLYYGLRADIDQQLSDPIFVLELAGHLLLIALAMVMTCLLAYPDRQKRSVQLIGSIAAIGLLVGLFLLQAGDSTLAFHEAGYMEHGMACLACVMSFALVPVIFMIWRIRQLAPVQLSEIAIWMMVMCMSVGAFGVRLVIEEDAHLGHLLWHIAPIALGVLLMLALGRKIFRW